jgi:MFS family permease
MTDPAERVLVRVLAFICVVMAVISSLGAPLIPAIAQHLHASIGDTQWSLTATLVVGAVASPLLGRLGDGRHRRAVLLGTLAAVSLGGVLAALATSLPVLVGGRAMQGLGLALLPLSMAVARDHLSAARLGPTIALLSVAAMAGVGLGYPLTGLLAAQVSISAAFWCGALVAALALVFGAFVVPAAPDVARRRSIDLLGAVTIAAGLVMLLIGLDRGPDWGWGSPRTLGLMAAGLALLGLWARHELSTRDPLVELRLLRHRNVLTANLAGLVLGVTMYIVLVSVTSFVQLPGFGLGESVFVAGLTLVPMSAFSFVASRTLPAAQRRIGLRAIIPVGASTVALAMLFFALTTSALWQMFVTMSLVGLGLGYTYAAMPGLIVNAIPADETGSAMGFYQVSRYVGFSIGSGLCITLLRALGVGNVPTLHSYRATALIAAGVAIGCAVLSWVLPGRSTSDAPPPDPERAFEEGIVATAGLELLEESV